MRVIYGHNVLIILCDRANLAFSRTVDKSFRVVATDKYGLMKLLNVLNADERRND